jgi:polyribonucleotide nucleotidyltransferase
MSENDMFEAILFGHSTIREILELQREFLQKVGAEKPAYVPPPDAAFSIV